MCLDVDTTRFDPYKRYLILTRYLNTSGPPIYQPLVNAIDYIVDKIIYVDVDYLPRFQIFKHSLGREVEC